MRKNPLNEACVKIREMTESEYAIHVLDNIKASYLMCGPNTSQDMPSDHYAHVLYKGGCTCAHNENRRTINLIFVGQKGSGKTQMIDVFANYLLGLEFYDRFRYKLQTPASEMRSNCVTIHHIPAKYINNRLSLHPSCVNLIDTPGFS